MSSKCIYCGKSPSGYYYQDWRGTVVCQEHKDCIIQCDSCYGFYERAGSDVYQVEKGRFVCKTCIDNEVTLSNLGWTKKQVLSRLSKVGFDDIRDDILNIKIISKEEMNKMNEIATGLHYGWSDICVRGRYNFEQTIFVMSHLNKIHFAKILAHEYLHAWQLQNNIWEYNEYENNHKAKCICEGFAQMGSYLILSTIEHPLAKQLLESMFRDDEEVYGKSFQKIFKRYEEVGWFGIIREARLKQLKID